MDIRISLSISLGIQVLHIGQRRNQKKQRYFKRIEPYLTFLDYEELERKGADIASQLEEKDRMIQNMMRRQEKFEEMIQSLIDSGQAETS